MFNNRYSACGCPFFASPLALLISLLSSVHSRTYLGGVLWQVLNESSLFRHEMPFLSVGERREKLRWRHGSLLQWNLHWWGLSLRRKHERWRISWKSSIICSGLAYHSLTTTVSVGSLTASTLLVSFARLLLKVYDFLDRDLIEAVHSNLDLLSHLWHTQIGNIFSFCWGHASNHKRLKRTILAFRFWMLHLWVLEKNPWTSIKSLALQVHYKRSIRSKSRRYTSIRAPSSNIWSRRLKCAEPKIGIAIVQNLQIMAIVHLLLRILYIWWSFDRKRRLHELHTAQTALVERK